MNQSHMTTENDKVELALPKSQLQVSGGRLVRLGRTSDPVSEIPLASIKDVSVRMSMDNEAVIISAVLFAGAAACKLFIHSTWLSWSLCVVIGLISFLGLLGAYRALLTVATHDGTATFEVKEGRTDAEAFALAIKQKRNSCAD